MSANSYIAPNCAEGPFSWVFFFKDHVFGWKTYTYRVYNVSPTGTKLNALVSSPSNFDKVFVETSLLPRKV